MLDFRYITYLEESCFRRRDRTKLNLVQNKQMADIIEKGVNDETM